MYNCKKWRFFRTLYWDFVRYTRFPIVINDFCNIYKHLKNNFEKKFWKNYNFSKIFKSILTYVLHIRKYHLNNNMQFYSVRNIFILEKFFLKSTVKNVHDQFLIEIIKFPKFLKIKMSKTYHNINLITLLIHFWQLFEFELWFNEL